MESRLGSAEQRDQRGEQRQQFIMTHKMDILMVGNKSTFVNTKRREEIEIILGTTYVRNYIRKWNVFYE